MTHQCTVCLKQFDFVSKLRRHQLTHSGQRPFTCYICLKSFRQSAHLKGHLKSHSKLREVSLIVSQAINSQLSYTKTEDRYSKHGAWLSVEGEPAEENMWYDSLQTGNRGEFEHQSDSVKEQNHVKYLITDNGQMCDSAQGRCNGFEDLTREVSVQNCQFSDCTKVLPNSANTTESTVEKQEHLKSNTGDTQTRDSSIEDKMATMTGRHQCSVCLKCFSAPSKLKRHVLIHSSLRPFCCEFCPKAFRQLAHLKMHISTHFSQRQTKLKEATPGTAVSPLAYQSKASQRQWTEKPWNLEKELKGSEKVHMEPFPKTLIRVKSLNAAENWSKNKAGHECSVCRKCFSAPSKLRRHCLTHTGQRPFQCSLCGRAFRQLSHLKAHHSVHTAPRRKSATSFQTHRSLQPQPCASRTARARLKRSVHISLAKKFRSAKQKLKTSAALLSQSAAASIMISDNISESAAVRSSSDRETNRTQDYSCSVCSKHFNAPSKLRRHLLIHTGQRPFRCSVCFRGFRQKSHLKVHKCKGGSRAMCQSDVSEVHLRDPDGSKPKVSIRKGGVIGRESFISSSGMGEGSVCSPSAEHASRFIPEDGGDLASLSHKAVSTPLDEANQTKESGYQCTICFKIFEFPSKLSRHLLIHMDIKPFQCSICSKSFRQLCHLQSHSKVHTVRKNTLCQGTYKSGREPQGTSIPDTPEAFCKTNNCTRESGNPPVAQTPYPYCDDQNAHLVNKSSCFHSINMEELTPDSESTSTPTEVHQGEDSSSQMKRNTNQCIYCLKTFDFPSKLSRHLLVHTGIRPYECHVCCKSFKQLSHLQCHQWVHSRKENSELNASMASPISCGGTSLTDEPDLHEESSESSAMVNEGPDGYTVQVHHQKWISEDNCFPSEAGRGERKVKSETDLLLENSVYPTAEHDADPFGSDSTSGTVHHDCLEQQAEKLESKDFKHCLDRTGEVLPSAADGCTRIPDWNSMDQEEMIETRDSGPFVQKVERTNSHSLPFCNPEDSLQNHQHQDSQKGEDHNQHLTEPPNDLPICPSCSQCFDSVQKLNAHSCPVRCPKPKLSKSYLCAVCFKSFEAPSKLKRHYVIHTGQRPYRCSMCDKDFTQSGHLKTHMLSHR